MVKQFFIPAHVSIIELEALPGVAVKPVEPGTYIAIAGAMAEGLLVVPEPVDENDWAIIAPAIAVPTIGVGQVAEMSSGLWRLAETFEQRWTRDGVDIPGAIDRSYTIVAADRGKTIDGWMRGIDGEGNPSNWVRCLGSIQVPDEPPYLGDEEWTAAEALSLVDTRKATVEVTVGPGAGYEWAVSAGSAEFGDLGAVAPLTWDGTKWVWIDTTPAVAGATVFTRIARRLTADPAIRTWASGVKSWTASRAPVLPAWTVETSSAVDGAVRVTLAAPVNDGGRPTTLEIEVDGGPWELMPFGIDAGAREVSGSDPALVSVRLRATNVNGSTIGGPQSAVPKAPPTAITPMSYERAGGLFSWAGSPIQQFVQQGELYVWLLTPGGDQSGGGDSGGGGGGDPTEPPDVSDTPSADLPLWGITATDAAAYAALIEFTVEDL